jgi:hypothetical protein
LSKVIAFRKKLEAGRDTLYRTFNSEGDFGKEVDVHLRAFAREDGPPIEMRPAAVDISAAPLGPLQADHSLVQAQLAEVALARAALAAASDGRLQEATLLFAKATESTTDLQVLEVAADFYRQVDQPENASRLVRRHAALAEDRMVAARHLLAVQPPGWARQLQMQMMDAFARNVAPEDAEELRAIAEEVFGGERLETFTLEQQVKFFSAAELLEMARSMASAEGQSMILKYPQFMAANMAYGEQEFLRVARERHEARERAQAALPAPTDSTLEGPE